MKNFLIIIFSLLILIGCKNHNDINDKSKRNGNWVWWVDAKTGKEGWIPIGNKTTVKDGKYTLFFPNGNLCEHGKLIDGNLIDTEFIYNTQGELELYVFAKPIGNYSTVINEGKDTVYYYIINDGSSKIYRHDGSIEEQGVSKNHKKYGPWIGYFADGNKKYVRNFIDSSSWELDYYENGVLQDSGYDYKHTGLYQLCKTWYENGQLETETKWRNDAIQEGIAKEYAENDDSVKSIIQSISTWKDGVQNGIECEYYSDGKLKDSCNVINGVQDGIGEEYYENGNLKIIYYWNNGTLLGKKKYDENGILISGN